MGERALHTENQVQKENHGRLVQLTYHRNSDGSVDVLQTPSPIKLVATCPSERRVLQDQYSRPAYQAFNQWHQAGEKADLRVLSRDAHTGWVEFTDQGIIHVIKDVPTPPYGFALDGIGGAVKVGEMMRHAAMRELAEETVLVDLRKGKLLTPDVDLNFLTEMIYQHYLHADSLEVGLPSDIVDIIMQARLRPADFTEIVPSHIPQFEGRENLVVGKFRSEMDNRVDEMDGILTVHPDGLNILKPMFIPTNFQDLRIVDLECLENNRDETARPLKRNFTALSTPAMRDYLTGQEVTVPILGTGNYYSERISSQSYGIKNLGLAFARTVTNLH